VKPEEETKEEKQEAEIPVNLQWIEKLNKDSADPIDINELKPLYVARKDASEKKNVLLSVRLLKVLSI
jgi:hypothetical protein